MFPTRPVQVAKVTSWRVGVVAATNYVVAGATREGHGPLQTSDDGVMASG